LFFQRREGFHDICKYDRDSSATHNMESRSALYKVDIVSESEDPNREEEIIKSSIFVGTSSSKISLESAEKHIILPSGDTSETENISADMLLRSLGKRKVSKGPRSSDDFPYKKPRMFTSDIPSANHILNTLSISEIGDARSDFKESGGNQLDDSSKKTSNKDSCGGSLTSTTEDVARNTNKESSANNMFSSSREHTLSRWSALERDLYLKGVEIFGKNRYHSDVYKEQLS
jgi:histone-lysine N-methyltransferase EZH2